MNSTTNISCTFFYLLLNRTDRIYNYEMTKKAIPDLKVFHSYDYSKVDILREFRKMRMRFKDMTFNSYGMLANGVTKLRAFEYQIKMNIPYAIFLEDDVLVFDEKFTDTACNYLVNQQNGLVRFGVWGEAYASSYNGAKYVMRRFCEKGITRNIDDQLNEFIHYSPNGQVNGWSLKAKTNRGHISESKHYDKLKLRGATRKYNKSTCDLYGK